MKEIAITLITPITIVAIIFLCGLISSRPKIELNITIMPFFFL